MEKTEYRKLGTDSGPLNGSTQPLMETASPKWSKEMRQRAKALTGQLETGYMELAHLLYQVYDTPVDGNPMNPPIYTAWGYKSFAEYAEGDLGIHRRKAERLRRIWYTVEIELKGLDPTIKERIVKIGWSKARELVRVLTLENAEEWVAIAEKCNYPSLSASVVSYLQKLEKKKNSSVFVDADLIRNQMESEVKPVVERVTFEHFPLYDEQVQNVRLAIEQAKKLSKSDKKGHNLDLICTDFLATNDFGTGEESARLKFLAKLEAFLGMRLIAVDSKTEEVVYGVDTLQKIARSM